jgi:Asp-tRNA(Asn)/Glu-tRNA(Gln) amidotransferase C subunit
MTKDDLKVTAEAARLRLSDAELDAVFPAFAQMLDYFSQMQDALKDDAAFGASIAALARTAPESDENWFREDAERAIDDPAPSTASAAVLLGNSTDNDGRFFVVPNVL